MNVFFGEVSPFLLALLVGPRCHAPDNVDAVSFILLDTFEPATAMKVICLDRGVVILLVAVPAIAFTVLHYDSAFPCPSCVVDSTFSPSMISAQCGVRAFGLLARACGLPACAMGVAVTIDC